MTATATETGETRLEKMERTLPGLYEKRDLLIEKISSLPEREHQARIEAIKTAPTQRPGALGSRVAKLRQDRRDAEKDLASLEADIRGFEEAVREEREKRAKERLKDRIREAKRL